MPDAPVWTKLIIPAIASEDADYPTGPDPHDVHHRRTGEVLLPDREPREVLEAMRVAIGSMTFAAQYQQDPVPADGNVIKRDWLCYLEELPDTFERTISSWDLASTLDERSSYSVGQHWGVLGTRYYLLDVIRRRLEAPALRQLIMDTLADWEPDANLVEETELGRSLVQDLRRTERAPLVLRRPKIDKQARLLAQSARFEARQVILPQSASWLADYTRELLAFPFGKNDDQVDATSQALDYLTAKAARAGPIVRRDITRRSIVRRDVVRN